MHLTRLIIQSSGIVEPKELKQKGLVETFIVRKKSKSFEIDIASSNLPELFLELPRFAEVISIAIVDSTKERNRNRNLHGAGESQQRDVPQDNEIYEPAKPS
jgi:hypothetical protein